MEKILDKIVDNNLLFAGIIIFLCALLVGLIILIIRSLRGDKKINIYEEELEDEDIKKVRKVKKEDIIESPNTVEEEIIVSKSKKNESKTIEELELTREEDIEQRYDIETEKEIEEIIEETKGTEIEQLIKEMEDSSRVKPEDVVANFEEEQEAQSIISYKELVNAVKNRQDKYYEDELESRPLTKVSDFMKEKEKNDTQDIIREITKEKEVKIKEEPKIEENTKFHKTDFISPVFGRMTEDTVTVKEIKKSVSNQEGTIDDIYQHMADNLRKENDTSAFDYLTNDEKYL